MNTKERREYCQNGSAGLLLRWPIRYKTRQARLVNLSYGLATDLIRGRHEDDMREPRGAAHFVYLNRTYVGLFSLLTDLGAVVQTH